MHYSLKNILSADELKYFIDYYDSHEHYVTKGMEKLAIPFDDADFMAVIHDLIKNKLGITANYTIVGDNYYKHDKSYFPHCDATNERAWLNIVIPLVQYNVFGSQKFVVFDQLWLGPNVTWMGPKINKIIDTNITEDFASNKKINQRPTDSEFLQNDTAHALPQVLWQQFDDNEFGRDYLHGLDGIAYNWIPGDIIVFDSQHIHATGKMQCKSKLGLSIRIDRL
jgi:hypothetical protein